MKHVWIRCTAMVMMLCLLAGCASSGPTIAAFSYDNATAVVEENIGISGYGDKTAGYTATEGEGLLFASVNGTDLRKLEWTKDSYSDSGMCPAMTGGNKNPWGEGAYLEMRVSTKEVSSVRVYATLGATNKGPKDYRLQYSTDGQTFTDVGGVKSLENNKTLEALFNGVKLPSDAAGLDTLYIRIAVASDATVGGEVTLYGSTSGETAIGTLRVTA